MLDSQLPVLHKNLIKMLATSCVNVTVVKLHVAVTRSSLAANSIRLYLHLHIFE